MTTPPWDPDDVDPDRADDERELIAALPAHQRVAAAALLDLGDYEIPLPGHSASKVPAGRVFVMLASGRLPAAQIEQYLRAYRLLRPGVVDLR